MRLTLGLVICDELAAHDALPSPAALDALGQLRHYRCTWEFHLQASASLAASRANWSRARIEASSGHGRAVTARWRWRSLRPSRSYQGHTRATEELNKAHSEVKVIAAPLRSSLAPTPASLTEDAVAAAAIAALTPLQGVSKDDCCCKVIGIVDGVMSAAISAVNI